MLTYICVLVGFLSKIVTSVHGFEHDRFILFMWAILCILSVTKVCSSGEGPVMGPVMLLWKL